RAPYLTAAAAILADELAAPAEAARALDQALDLTPRDPALWQRMERLFAEVGDPRLQAGAVRRQIKRLDPAPGGDDVPALLGLWRGLAELARLRLDDHAGAVAALEAALALDPQDLASRRVLADLHWAAEPPAHGAAIAQHREIVARGRDVAELEPDVRALLRLFVETGALDEAHAAAGALVIAGRADPQERALYDQYRPRAPLPVAGELTESTWQAHLRHPDQDPLLSLVLAAVTPVVAASRARPAKDLGLKKKLRRDLTNDPSRACRMLARAGQMLGVALPEVYLLEDQTFDLDVVDARTDTGAGPVVLIGQGMSAQRPELEAAFVAGRVAAWLRPEQVLRWPQLMPTAGELVAVVTAALRAVDDSYPLKPELAEAVAPIQTLLGQMPPQERERLSAAVRRYRASPAWAEDASAVVGRWLRGAVFTAIRAGWVACGDLEIASRLGQSFAGGAAIDPGEVLRDLMAFAVSAGFAEIRAELGVTTVDLRYRA